MHYTEFLSIQNPMGQINMRDTRVEEVEHISDSDSDDTNRVDKSVLQPTIGKDTLYKMES